MLSRLTRTVVVGSVAAFVAVPAIATSATAAAPPTCDGRPATIVGTAGNDNLVGTAGDDVIWAGDGDDVVRAGAGDDVVCGNGGSDTLYGNKGNDRLFGMRDGIRSDRGGEFLVGDTLRGGAGDDLLDVGTDDRELNQGTFGNTVSWSASPTAVKVDLGSLTATGEGTDTIVASKQLTVIGSAHADELIGSEGPDDIVGGPGGDTIDGRGGNDTLAPEDSRGAHLADDDVVQGGAGDDQIYALAGHDVLHGGPGDDSLGSSASEPAKVYGDEGDDSLFGDLVRTGGYVLDGGPGRDSVQLYRPDLPDSGSAPSGPMPRATLDLAAGTLHVAWTTPTDATATALEGIELADHVIWKVFGTSGPDTVGGAYNGRLEAHMRGGDDTIEGTADDDAIDGGAGKDTANGLGGDDVCKAVEVRYSCTLVR